MGRRGRSRSSSPSERCHAYGHRQRSIQSLAEEPCHVEIELLGEPSRERDQYIAAFGGLTQFDFHAEDPIDVDRLAVSAETLADLEDQLLLFFTGYSSRASSILADQKQRSEHDDEAMIANLDYVNDLGLRIGVALKSCDTATFATLIHEDWTHNRRRSTGISAGHSDKVCAGNGAPTTRLKDSKPCL